MTMRLADLPLGLIFPKDQIPLSTRAATISLHRIPAELL